MRFVPSRPLTASSFGAPSSLPPSSVNRFTLYVDCELGLVLGSGDIVINKPSDPLFLVKEAVEGWGEYQFAFQFQERQPHFHLLSTVSPLEFAPTPASLVPDSLLSREKTNHNATLAFLEFGH